MTGWEWVALGVGLTLVVYAAFLLGLLLAGRRGDARALATFLPDCLVLLRELLRDPRVSSTWKMLLGAVIVYLALPFDLVPDFIPVAGQLDDAIIVAAVLHGLLRSSGPDLLREHWRGPQRSLEMLLRLASAGSAGSAELPARRKAPGR